MSDQMRSRPLREGHFFQQLRRALSDSGDPRLPKQPEAAQLVRRPKGFDIETKQNKVTQSLAVSTEPDLPDDPISSQPPDSFSSASITFSSMSSDSHAKERNTEYRYYSEPSQETESTSQESSGVAAQMDLLSEDDTSYPSFDYTSSSSFEAATSSSADWKPSLRHRVDKAPPNTPTDPHERFGYQASVIHNIRNHLGLDSDAPHPPSVTSSAESDISFDDVQKTDMWFPKRLPSSEVVREFPLPLGSRGTVMSNESQVDNRINATEECVAESLGEGERMSPDETSTTNHSLSDNSGLDVKVDLPQTKQRQSHDSLAPVQKQRVSQTFSGSPTASTANHRFSDSDWSYVELPSLLSTPVSEASHRDIDQSDSPVDISMSLDDGWLSGNCDSDHEAAMMCAVQRESNDDSRPERRVRVPGPITNLLHFVDIPSADLDILSKFTNVADNIPNLS